MSFCLPLYVYKSLQEKLQREFEKKNKILTPEDIEYIIQKTDKKNIVRAFKSAVIDHTPINGRPYYLSAPIPPLFYHDNFKRCRIAEALGINAAELESCDFKDALETLHTLLRGDHPGYVRIFVWITLGKYENLGLLSFEDYKADLERDLGGSTAHLLGGLLFLSRACEGANKTQAMDFLEEGKKVIRYKIQRALWGYFTLRLEKIYKEASQMTFEDRDIQSFLEKCRQREFIPGLYFEEGAREIGIISRTQKNGLMEGTQQADICLRLKPYCQHYLSAIGYYLKTYWE